MGYEKLLFSVNVVWARHVETDELKGRKELATGARVVGSNIRDKVLLASRRIRGLA